MNELLTDELRAAFRERFDDVAATPTLYERIQRRIVRHRRVRVVAALATTASVLAAVVVVPGLLAGDELRIADQPEELAGRPAAAPAADPTHALFTTQSGGLIGVELASGRQTDLIPERDHSATVIDLTVAAGSSIEDFTAIAFDDGAGPIGFITYARRDGGQVQTAFTPNDGRLPGHSNRGFRTISPDGRWLAYSASLDESRHGVGIVPIDGTTGELDTDRQQFVDELDPPVGWTGPVAAPGDRSVMVHAPYAEGRFTATILERTSDGFSVVETLPVGGDTVDDPDGSSRRQLAFGSLLPGRLDDARFDLAIEPVEVETGELVRPDLAVVRYRGPDGRADVRFELSGHAGNPSLSVQARTALLTFDAPSLSGGPETFGEAWLVRAAVDGDEITLEPRGPLVRGVVSGVLVGPGGRRGGDFDRNEADDDSTSDADPEAGAGSEDRRSDTDAAGSDRDQRVVQVHFGAGEDDPSEVTALQRTVALPAILTGALESLLEGPTEQEREDGYVSFFSPQTSGLLLGVRVVDGVAYVDFDPSLPEIIPNASTSAGSSALLAALDATATQFDTVDAAVYSLAGDIEAFYTWLQRTSPDS